MSAVTIINHLLPDPDQLCFVIPQLFTQSECETILNEDTKKSFQKAISNYPTYYRNNDRLVVDNQLLADLLFKKIKDYLPQQIEIKSGIENEKGLWSLSELNNRFRFCRYSANQYFHRHLDGVHYRSTTEQSKLTFMLYLNDASEFKGGRTLFFKSKDSTELWASYIPRQGDLIVFDHNIWHEGEELTQGEKYVLRSDILYKLERPVLNTNPFEGHLGYIWKLLVFDDQVVISGGRDKDIRTWNTNGIIQQTLKGHQNSILCLEKINPNTFISGSRDKLIKVWERKNGDEFEFRNEFEAHSALVLSLCNLGNNVFASGGGDNTIKIFTPNGETLHAFNGHTNWIWQIIKLDNNYLASCSEDKTIRIWNYRNKTHKITFENPEPVFSLAYSLNKKQLISGDLLGSITIRSFDNNYHVKTAITFNGHKGIIRTIILINDELIASGGEDNKIRVWNIGTQKCVAEFEHLNFVQSLIVTNENTLLSASYDGAIKSWSLASIG
jgi:WD40 repeat protein